MTSAIFRYLTDETKKVKKSYVYVLSYDFFAENVKRFYEDRKGILGRVSRKGILGRVRVNK